MVKLAKRTFMQRLYRWMPGLQALLSYQRSNLNTDLKAGLSVAAVALPVSIAYAELTGVGAIAGLYSSILPLIVYALFGTSRQLIVGPDTATCAVIAAVVMPLAMGDAILRWQLVIIMTLMIGFWCIIAGYLRLGAMADLLSRPILIGLLNGISITIIIDQLAKIGNFKYQASGLVERVLSLPSYLQSAHLGSVTMSLFTLLLLMAFKHFKPRWPGPLFVVILLTFLSWLANFEDFGIRVIGQITNEGLPLASWSNFEPGLLRELVVPSINIAIICFVSMMITVQSFAAKNNYDVDVDADAEFRALGFANLAAGLSQGFVVSGTSSRTAVNDNAGGKTQLVSMIAALIILLVVLFLLQPLQYIPVAVLGVILIYSSWSLINFKVIVRFYSRNRDAFYLSLATFVSVTLIGIIPGMALSVLLGLFLFLRKIFRPSDQLLGIDAEGRIHSISKKVKAIDDVMIYRFNSPLTYFNIGYFKRRLLTLIDESKEPVKWVVVDTIPSFTYPDVSVLAGIDELVRAFQVRDVVLVLAGRRKTLMRWFEDLHIDLNHKYVEFAPDLYIALRMIQSREKSSH